MFILSATQKHITRRIPQPISSRNLRRLQSSKLHKVGTLGRPHPDQRLPPRTANQRHQPSLGTRGIGRTSGSWGPSSSLQALRRCGVGRYQSPRGRLQESQGHPRDLPGRTTTLIPSPVRNNLPCQRLTALSAQSLRPKFRSLLMGQVSSSWMEIGSQDLRSTRHTHAIIL